MKCINKITSLSLLIGSLLISTLNATNLIEDMKVISGKLVYEKKPVLETIEISKAIRPSVEKDLSSLYIKDNQNKKYRIFDNVNDNRFLKLALLNHFKVSFIEDLHDKEINFMDISNNSSMKKMLNTHKQFLIRCDNVETFLISIASKICPFNIIDEYQSSSLDLESQIAKSNIISEPDSLSNSSINQLINEFENLTVSDTNQIVDEQKTIIKRLSSWVTGD